MTWYEEGVAPSEPTVVCGTCGMGQKTVQNAGRAFWDRFERQQCQESVDQPCDEQEDDKDKGRGLNEREKALEEKRAKREREKKERDGGLLKIS